MSGRVRITGEVPSGLPKAERVQAYAEAIDAGLRTVAADPGMRLAMILGEAGNKFRELVDWLIDEIAKDEAKAPGLKERARACAYDPSILASYFPDHPSLVAGQQQILEAAFKEMTRKVLASDDDGDPPLTIEGTAEHVE